MEVVRKLQILRGWMDAGNFWYTSLEYLLRPEVNERLDLDELRHLNECGLMDRRQYGVDDFWVVRYRVSKHGKEWMKNPPSTGARVRLKRREPERPMVDCEQCDGVGVWNDNDCPQCGGEGRMSQPSECPHCEGGGVDLLSGKDCPRCEATGEWRPSLPPEKVAPAKPMLRIRRP